MSIPRPWGCPKCKCTESLVKDTDRDEEGYIIRNRRCQQCRTMWATAELPIAATFYSRAVSRKIRYRRVAAQKAGPITCKRCGGPYKYGFFSMHVRMSPTHAAAIPVLASNGMRRADVRNYRREYTRRKAGAA